MLNSLKSLIENWWPSRHELTTTADNHVDLRQAVQQVFAMLDSGNIRVAERIDGAWITNEWIKKAILMSFRLNPNRVMGEEWYDKVPLKFSQWNADQFKEFQVRAVPGSVVRHGAFIGKNVVLMPSFVNIGAYVDEGTMVDTWATIGSCAQIGKNCHISGGTGIGGVLEPVNASPVVIEDDCFIGARSEVVEGVIVEAGSIISMGVYIGASTKIVNRETGEVLYGRVPAGSVVVPGSVPSKNGVNLYAAVIIKTVDESTRKKVGLNDLLRA